MGLTALFYPWGFILQAAAILHFVRRRPDTYWLWIILIGGALGALVYIVAEVLPDVDLVRGSLNAFPRRRRIRELERIIIDNPAVGNLEELADPAPEAATFQERGRFVQNVIGGEEAALSAARVLEDLQRRGMAVVVR